MKQILMGCATALILLGCGEDNVVPENPADMPYNVMIDPAQFLNSGIVGNDYFPLANGKRYVYEGENEDKEPVRVETELTTETKVVMGIVCAVVRDRAYENGELVEDTYDWYAQDVDGNVWYFGEATQEIEGGSVVNTDGSWEAGVDGALPGIIMLAKPIAGMWYRQEYYENEAEDVAQILSLGQNVTVAYGPFTNSLQVAEWNLLEPGIVEHKFYAAGVGNIRTVAVKGESGFEDLVSIEDI